MKDYLRNKKGITLIALVITIVIMLILASVTINMTIGERGIITKAKNAKIAVKLAEIRESIQVDIISIESDSADGSITDVQLRTVLEKYGDVIEDDDPNHTPIGVTAKDGGTVLGDIMIDELFSGGVVPATPDTTNPVIASLTASNVTSSGFTLTANATDNVGITSYQFYVDGVSCGEASASNTVTVTGKLYKAGGYDCHVVVTDAAGNTASNADNKTNVILSEVESAVDKATVSPTGWTNGNVTVTLPASENGYTRYYGEAIDAINTEYPSAGIPVSSNTTIFYAYKDDVGNIGAYGTVNIDNIDKTNPTTATIESSNVAATSFTLSATGADNVGGSGIARYIFYIKASGASSYDSYTVESAEGTASKTIDGLTAGTTYSYYVQVVDKAGNTLVSVTDEDIPTVTTAVPPLGVTSTETTHSNVSNNLLSTYSIDWAKLSELAKAISDDTTHSIGTSTAEVTLTQGSNTYTLGVGDKVPVYINSVTGLTGMSNISAGTYNVRILGFKHDQLASTSAYGGTNTYAGISFEFERVITTGRMNSSETNSGGWNSTEIKGTLNNSVLPAMKQTQNGTEMMSSVIKSVVKTYIPTYNQTSTSTSSSSIWLLSCSEIWSDGYNGGRGYATTAEGNQYKYYAIKTSGTAYSSSNSNIVKKDSSEAAKWWWLRSPSYYMNLIFCSVRSDGGCNYTYAYDGASSTYGGVSPGFCI